MNSQIKKALGIATPLFIGIAIIYYQFSGLTSTEYDSIKNTFATANYYIIIASLFVAFFGHFFRAYRWKYTLQHIGYKTSFTNRLLTVGISYLVNYTIPRSGEISRAILLKKYEEVPFDKGFGTIVAERIIDLILFFLFVVLALILEFKTLYGFFAQYINPKQLLLIGFAAVLFGLTILYLLFVSKISFFMRIKAKLNGLIEGVTSVLKLKEKIKFIILSFLIWLSYFVMFYIAIFALPETENISFVVVLMGFIFGSLAIGFTNSGLGSYPFAVAQIFLLYKTPLATGLAFGWLVWTSQTIFTIIMGLLCYLLLPIVNKKNTI